MSRGYNTNGLFVDTGLLRDHVSKLREQKKTASGLYEMLLAMRGADEPSAVGRYDRILREVERLVEYLGRMADVLENASDDAVEMSRELGGLIRDDADQVHYVASNALML